MKYIGIVGCSVGRWITCADPIMSILGKYNPQDTTIVSGGADGVDRIAVKIAKKLGFKVIEYLPKGIGWQYYMPRNLLIANKCDKVYSVALSLIGNGTKCYHCARAGLDNNHFKTAGCWTALRCKDHEVVVAQC